MPAVTGAILAQDAFGLLNVFLPGESIPAADGAKALRAINDILSEWSQHANLAPIVARELYPLVANQGGTLFPYTIGLGGNFNTPKPSNQSSIVAANLVLTATTPLVRVPLGIFTDDAYDANRIPDLANSQPTALYYNPTYASGDLGSIRLWPVPTVSTNTLELFIQQSVAQFANLTTTYYVPDGWPRALKYALADDLQTPYGKSLSAAAQRIALTSKSTITRANLNLSDLANDATWAGSNRSFYNINTGQ
jgi:hypothetical protein